MFKMSGVIQFTDVIDSFILWLFFEVSTDAVVIHVAGKLTLIQVFDVFNFDFVFTKRLSEKKK